MITFSPRETTTTADAVRPEFFQLADLSRVARQKPRMSGGISFGDLFVTLGETFLLELLIRRLPPSDPQRGERMSLPV